MAEKLLGTDFAIHGGGRDLVFPHHENEVAQTEAGRGEPLARLWMHNGMVELAAEKMSKSEGNIFGLAEALDAYGPEAVVAFLASGHYRQPLEFSDAGAERGRRTGGADPQLPAQSPSLDGEEDAYVAERREALLEALADDFNTPRAFAALFELIAEANRRPLPGAREAVAELLPLLGLDSLLVERRRAPMPRRKRLSPSASEARDDGRLRAGRQASRRARGPRLRRAGRARREPAWSGRG